MAAAIQRTTGPSPRHRPMLLALVYGVFLVLIGGISVALALVVGAHFSTVILNTTVAHDRALIGLWADTTIDAAELRGGSLANDRRGDLEDQLRSLAERSGMLHIELRDTAGNLLLSSDASSSVADPPAGHHVAAAGTVSAELLETTNGIAGRATGPVLQEFLPLVETGGKAVAVVGVWRDARPLLAQLDAARGDVIMLVSAAGGVLALVLMIVFRAAHRRLARQSIALLETSRRDPLTGLLNHGATVAALAERLEVARGAGAALAIAVVDVDNFRLLNETHGHQAGDAVLSEVARQLAEHAPTGATVGRYGPDEFLLVGPPMAVDVVEQAIESARSDMRSVAIRFGDSESLPISVSAGIALFPGTASGVTDLLAAAANALADAKAAGGDAVRSANGAADAVAQHTTFSALQGLVFAVDNKDRYTKRHSEDVAAYAVFLGRQLGLGSDEIEQLRMAGLLHDVGKIGIPDVILRKPGALTNEEREIIQQHVALGDLIVRDLPDIDAVRAGVRHHHERWDGKGYLDRLAGEEIPLIARVLAVCDAYSAMTTTRPYRRALGMTEALKRLGDAAGTQLDERVVTSFVKAMDTIADAPRPDDETVRVKLWLPARSA